MEKNITTRITTATTTTLFTGPGTVDIVIVPKTLTGVVTVNDSDGTTTTAKIAFGTTTATNSYMLRMAVTRGATVVTAAADEVVVSWRQGL